MKEAGPQIALNESANTRENLLRRSKSQCAVSGQKITWRPEIGGRRVPAPPYERRPDFHLQPDRYPAKTAGTRIGTMAPVSRLNAAPAPPPPQAIARREFARDLPWAARRAHPRPVGRHCSCAPRCRPDRYPRRGSRPGSASPMVSVRTADNVERWRFGRNGTIQHRDPDGAWQGQSAESPPLCEPARRPPPRLLDRRERRHDPTHHRRRTLAKIDSPTPENLVAVFGHRPLRFSPSPPPTADASPPPTPAHTWRPL